MSNVESSVPQSRGPADHSVREQIVEAAEAHFSHYGYEKTTVSDLARAIGFSKAYIYKFFDSKQAIGETICSTTLSTIVAAVEAAVATMSPTWS
jgi:AcrR family transcriptional regulator